MLVVVRSGTIEEAIQIQEQIPEFENGYTAAEYTNRLLGGESVILIAEIAGKLAGFKVGYDRFLDGKVFYSWMGGVVPAFRGQGVAKILLQKMEVWCKLKGYRSLKFKTRNSHRSMIHFAIHQGFDVVDFEPQPNPDDSKIYFSKEL